MYYHISESTALGHIGSIPFGSGAESPQASSLFIRYSFRQIMLGREEVIWVEDMGEARKYLGR